ncbi:hypothetical protein [Halobaculum gomorrense]|uniref:Zinc ribbon domain-containing protein n=1 Tax=Halobaculum gomorrense TaxID=43928 RepID=A0A1M5KD62_9EURY|nr:hypothetical protein [Halobaculum gomorrense]SHG50419.1 hypothetical protein SAMN05443636_0455 [Halobaculum gomorrense]
MAAIESEPVVRLVLTAILSLVPTVAFLGLLRLLDRLRNDVLIEHTVRMAAEESGTGRLAGTRLDPAVVLGSERSDDSTRSAASDDLRRDRTLVLCAACAMLRPSRSGACPTCGEPLSAEDSEGTAGQR